MTIESIFPSRYVYSSTILRAKRNISSGGACICFQSFCTVGVLRPHGSESPDRFFASNLRLFAGPLPVLAAIASSPLSLSSPPSSSSEMTVALRLTAREAWGEFWYTGMTTSTARPVRGLTVEAFEALVELPVDTLPTLAESFTLDLGARVDALPLPFAFSASSAATRYDLPFSRLVGTNK